MLKNLRILILVMFVICNLVVMGRVSSFSDVLTPGSLYSRLLQDDRTPTCPEASPVESNRPRLDDVTAGGQDTRSARSLPDGPLPPTLDSESIHSLRDEVKAIHPTRLSAPSLEERSLVQRPDAPPTEQSSVFTTYFVSKGGSNGDGKSWATAWNELDQVQWEGIQPGDSILLDGGSSEMIYRTTLTIGKSGTSDKPITIKLAGEPGRDGRAVIFGGRSMPLPYCGQMDYTYESTDVRRFGIMIEDLSWVEIDGTKWRGIIIHGHSRNGIWLKGAPSHITVRNMEIFDNGRALQIGSGWEPDVPGVNLTGTNIAFERVIIHDNGQDAFQSPGGIGNFALRSSWLYNTRPHPHNPDEPFNECRHSDGIQIFGGGLQSGVLIQNSIVGPGFMHGVMLGGGGQPNPPWAVINNVTIRNTLFFKSSNAEMHSNSNPTNPVNWRIENVTSFAQTNRKWHNIYLEGTGHTIQNSVFYGGRSITFPDGGFVTDGNCQWKLGGKTVGSIEDPLFIDVDENDWFSLDDFTVQNPACEGSSITSVSQLLAQPDSHYMFLPWILQDLNSYSASRIGTMSFSLQHSTARSSHKNIQLYEEVEYENPGIMYKMRPSEHNPRH